MGAELMIHCRSYTQASAAVRVGLGLAAHLRARAHGVYVVSLYPAAFATPETVALTLNEASREYEDALATTGFWRDQTEHAGVGGGWQVFEDDPVEALARCSVLADMLVMERPQLNPDAPTGWGLVSRTVFAASVPVLVVPDTCTASTCGRRVLVCWNGSRESARALQGALPVLRAAERIRVLDGVQRGGSLRRGGAPGVEPWFARHELPCEIEPFAPEGGRAAEAILSEARSFDADLIVMGAWGHSRVAELILGGATRHLFQNSVVPMLVAH